MALASRPTGRVVKSKSPSDASLVALASFTAAGGVAAQVMGRATRDALFLSTFEVKRLPVTMLAAAVASLLAAFGIGRFIARHSPARVLPLAFMASSALLALEWSLVTLAPRLIALALYLHMAVFGPTLISTFWSAINERFNPRTAKRYVGWIASGATAGGIGGGVAAFALARSFGVRDSLLVLAALHVVSAMLSGQLARHGRRAPVPGATPPSPAPSAFRVLSDVPYLRQLAVLVAAVATMEALADFVLNSRAAGQWANAADLLSFFAVFHMTVAFVTFVFQTLLGRVALERLGLVGAIVTLPLATIPTAAAAAFIPRLWAACLLRGTMATLGHSFYRGGYELLFSPLPIEQKRPTKTVIDVAFDRMGTALGSLLALSAIALAPGWAVPLLLVAMVALAVFAIALTRTMHRGYVQSLERSLVGGMPLGTAPRPELSLSQTQTRLSRADLAREIEALRRDNLLLSTDMASPFAWLGESSTSPPSAPPEPDPVVAATGVLLSGDTVRIRTLLEGSELDPRLGTLVIRLLADKTLSQPAVRSLRKVADRVAGQLADALLDPQTPFIVRRRVARTMSACSTQRAVDALVQGLQDERFEVRYQCGLSLLRVTKTTEGLVVAKEPVLAAVLREVDLERTLWQKKSPLFVPDDETDDEIDSFLRDRTNRSLEHVFAVLALVFEREPMRLALQALSGEDDHLRGTALEYLEQVLPEAVKGSLWPFVTAVRQGTAS
jgi:ATP:ADP antiporter, AAA family